jgi:predicted MPP superfamily phosphohydrolase
MKILLAILLILLMGFVGWAYFDTNSIEIKHYTIMNYDKTAAPEREGTPYASPLSPQSPVPSPVTSAYPSRPATHGRMEALNGLNIAHLSDLHMKRMGSREQKVLEILKDEKPDLIFITGDLIQFKSEFEPVVLFLSKLYAPLGIFVVLGNTEYSNENGSCIFCHEKGSSRLKENRQITFLRNSLSLLNVNGKIINIIGVDDPVNKKSDLDAALKGVHPNSPLILLAHSPEIFEEASNAGMDLLFCGHTHGGQIFITKFLRKVFPLIDPALEFLEGFFQKGNMLMYVSHGIGTSFLPFRLGVKPEITFFEFRNQSGPSNILTHIGILNNPSRTIFSGFDLYEFFETFNMFSFLRPLFDTKSVGHSNLLFDFETESDLKRLNWQCKKWFELSQENATSGRYSLKVILPPGRYPGISFQGIKEDWSKYEYLRLDVFNPSKENVVFHIRIDDNNSGWEYANRFDVDIDLRSEMNRVSIPVHSMKTNINPRPLDLRNIRRMMAFIPRNTQKREIYIDHIRLE